MARLLLTDIVNDQTPPVVWVVPGFIAEGALIMLVGEAGVGKTVFMFTLALAVATGTPFLGWSPLPRRVVYFNQENSDADMRQYARLAWNGLGCPSLGLADINLYLANFELGGTKWHEKLAQTVDAHHPHLIIIDTATPACNIKDENNNGEATQVTQHFREVQSNGLEKPAFVVMKHAKVRMEKDEQRTIRGAKSWIGEVDSMIFHVRTVGGKASAGGLRPTRLEPEKSRPFSLKEPIDIRPEFVPNALNPKGLRLHLLQKPEIGASITGGNPISGPVLVSNLKGKGDLG